MIGDDLAAQAITIPDQTLIVQPEVIVIFTAEDGDWQVCDEWAIGQIREVKAEHGDGGGVRRRRRSAGLGTVERGGESGLRDAQTCAFPRGDTGWYGLLFDMTLHRFVWQAGLDLDRRLFQIEPGGIAGGQYFHELVI